jgi:hypothetical protein
VLLFRCCVADLVSRYRVLERGREHPRLSASVHAARSIVCVPHVASEGRHRLVHQVGHVLAHFRQASLSVCSAGWDRRRILRSASSHRIWRRFFASVCAHKTFKSAGHMPGFVLSVCVACVWRDLEDHSTSCWSVRRLRTCARSWAGAGRLPLRRGVPRAASVCAVSPLRVWQRGRASARRRLWARCWRTSAAWAYFSGVGVSVADLEPDNLVSYVMDHWLEAHPGRGGSQASPVSVDRLFGNLSSALPRCGRVGPYQPTTVVGNPVDSVVVADFNARFGQHALPEGGRRAVQPYRSWRSMCHSWCMASAPGLWTCCGLTRTAGASRWVVRVCVQQVAVCLRDGFACSIM